MKISTRFRLSRWVLFAVPVLLGACSTLPDVEKAENFPVESQGPDRGSAAIPKVEPAPVRERALEEIGLGFTGPGSESYRIFTSPREMGEFINEKDLFRPVDFDREMVLACFMGEKPTGGYMSRIIRIEEGASSLSVYMEVTEPGPGDLVAQMLTRPWQAVATEATDKEIRWETVRAER